MLPNPIDKLNVKTTLLSHPIYNVFPWAEKFEKKMRFVCSTDKYNESVPVRTDFFFLNDHLNVALSEWRREWNLCQGKEHVDKEL